MKALILSLVIAFSSSFALANCPLADADFIGHEGAYTKRDKLQDLLQNNNTVGHQQLVDGGQTK